MTGSRGLPWAFVLAALSVLGASAPAAAAAPSRPYDAPSTEKTRAAVPPRPTGYLEHEEGGFTFAYHPSAHERVRSAIPAAIKARAALSLELGTDVLAGVEVRVAAVPDEIRTLGPLEDVPAYAPAIVFSKQRLVVTSLRSPRSLEPTELAVTLTHALAHLALDEALDHHPAPLWFHEGHAANLAGDAPSSRAQSLLMATLKRRLLPVADLEPSFPADAPESSLAYAESADLLRFLTDKPRRAPFAALITRVRGGEPFEEAIVAAYDVDLGSLEQAWRKDLARRYAFLPVFLGGAAAWLVFGVILLLRRSAARKKARAALEARRAQRPRHIELEQIAIARIIPSGAAAKAPSALEQEGTGEPMRTMAEIPKIEHEGDWHTLH